MLNAMIRLTVLPESKEKTYHYDQAEYEKPTSYEDRNSNARGRSNNMKEKRLW